MDSLQLNHPRLSHRGSEHAAAWRVRVSKRARNLRIQVFPNGGVEIVVPERTRQRDFDAFVNQHHEWVSRTQNEYLTRRAGEKRLPDEIELPAVKQRLRLAYSTGAKPQARQNGDTLLVCVPEKTVREVWPVLQSWLKRKARKHLSASLTQLSRETGLYPSRLQVRLQQTRWGSCSPNGTISLNAAVLLRSPEELRYVVIHELCHLQHLNHSRRYWRLVERHEPNYRAIDGRLAAAWETTPLWLSKLPK
jgi:predicted metal-dependent hydrolase